MVSRTRLAWFRLSPLLGLTFAACSSPTKDAASAPGAATQGLSQALPTAAGGVPTVTSTVGAASAEGSDSAASTNAAPSTGGTDGPPLPPATSSSTGVPASSGATGEPSNTPPSATAGVQPPPAGTSSTSICPASPFAAAPFASDAVAERVEGVPPQDAFADATMDVVILEGPVWIGDSLYLSEINSGSAFGGFPGGGMMAIPAPTSTSISTATPTSTSTPQPSGEPPPSRLLRVSGAGVVSVVLEDSGSNGLAITPDGSLVGGNHKTGAITRYDFAGAAPVDLVSSYEDVRFNSPNDLTFGPDGSLYFTDPDYQAPSPSPQSATRAYRVAPGTTTALPIAEGRNQPNGISFSPDNKTLYMSGTDGVAAYPVMPDGTLGTAVGFAEAAVRSSDGMAVDCAGNLYTTGSQGVIVVGPTGEEVARLSLPGVQSVSNVAFGGADHQTLYITTLGTGTGAGLFRIASAIPGMPY